eukprot:TRINITY_DN7327_c0_g1_i1.p1 TRINITY_DN7327_c0_g1~~TRINITY_DN7327_c0_g1_i1.p1  ORF type:complete len:1829 (-),score=190.19 TRINITY_DN7327_c0_g1_i1:62-4957(-)
MSDGFTFMECPNFLGRKLSKSRCSFDVLPTDDPIRDYMLSTTGFIVTKDIPSNVLTWVVVLEKLDIFTMEADNTHPFWVDYKILDGDFVVSFKNIIHGNSSFPTNAINATEAFLHCSDIVYLQSLRDEYHKATEDASIQILNGYKYENVTHHVDEGDLQMLINKIMTPLTSKEFLLCATDLESSSLFTKSIIGTQGVAGGIDINDGTCNFTPENPLFYKTPCCSSMATGCCPKQNEYIVNTSPNISFVETQCGDKALIENYAYSTQNKDSCDHFPIENFGEIYDRCSEQLKQYSCTSDVECYPLRSSYRSRCVQRDWGSLDNLGLRLGSSQRKNRVCSIPCKVDSDCLYGSCVKKEWERKEQYECQYHEGFDIFTHTADYPEVFTRCLAREILNVGGKFTNVALFKLGYDEYYSKEAELELASIIRKKSLNITTCPDYLTAYEKTTQAGCSSNASSCNWSGCTNETNVFCTDKNCEAPIGRKSSFCAHVHDGQEIENANLVSEITQNGYCIVFGKTQITQDVVMESREDPITGAWYVPRLTTKEECLPRDVCPESEMVEVSDFLPVSSPLFHPLTRGFVCLPKCFAGTETCTDFLVDKATWNSEISKCEVPEKNCNDQIAFSMWPGAVFLPPQFDTPERCTSTCRGDPHSSITTKIQCLQGYHCSLPNCPNCKEEECTSSGFCTALPGCYIPLKTDSTCDLNLMKGLFRASQWQDRFIQDIVWTPEGCTFRFHHLRWINEVSCLASGGKYRSHSEWKKMSPSDCTGLASTCYIPSNVTQNPLPVREMFGSPDYFTTPTLGPWPGNSLSEKEICDSCQGKITPGYQWIKGEWKKNSERDWMSLSWTTRKMTTRNTNVTVVSREGFISHFSTADFSLRAEALLSLTTCRLGNKMNNIPDILSSCSLANVTVPLGSVPSLDSPSPSFLDSLFGADAELTETTETSGLRNVDLSAVYSDYAIICGANGDQQTLNSRSLSLQFITQAQKFSCTEIVVGLVPKERFSLDTTERYKTGRSHSQHVLLYLEQSGLYVNSGVETGAIVGDGVVFDAYSPENNRSVYLDSTSDKGNLVFCYDLSNIRLDLEELPWNDSELVEWDFGYYDPDTDPGQPLSVYGLRVPRQMNNTDSTPEFICAPVIYGRIYFPVVSTGHEGGYLYLFELPDRVALLCAIIGYILFLLIATGILVHKVWREKKKTGRWLGRESKKNQVLWASISGVAGLVVILRFAYFLYIVCDPSFESEKNTIWLIELPSTLLWIIAAFNVNYWVEKIQTSTKSKCSLKCSKNCCLGKFRRWLQIYSGFTSAFFFAYLVVAQGQIGTLLDNVVLTEEAVVTSFVWYCWWILGNMVSVFWLAFLGYYIFFTKKSSKKVKKGASLSILMASIVCVGHTLFVSRSFFFVPLYSMEIWQLVLFITAIDIIPVILHMFIYLNLKVFRGQPGKEKEDHPIYKEAKKVRLQSRSSSSSEDYKEIRSCVDLDESKSTHSSLQRRKERISHTDLEESGSIPLAPLRRTTDRPMGVDPFQRKNDTYRVDLEERSRKKEISQVEELEDSTRTLDRYPKERKISEESLVSVDPFENKNNQRTNEESKYRPLKNGAPQVVLEGSTKVIDDYPKENKGYEEILISVNPFGPKKSERP